jgi:hypothetical protein
MPKKCLPVRKIVKVRKEYDCKKGTKMKKCLAGLWVVLLLAACSQQASPALRDDPEAELAAQAGSWQRLGGTLDFTADKTPLAAQMLLDRTEKPVVATIEEDAKGGRKVVLQKWTGSAWQDFTTTLALAAGASPLLDVQIDLNNRPVVFISTGSKTKGNPNVEDGAAYRYENGSWRRLGGLFDYINSFGQTFADLAIANDGNLYLLMSNTVRDNVRDKSWIRRWNGSSWQIEYTFQKITSVGSLSIAHAATSLRFTKDNKPVVTWNLTSDEWTFASTPPTQVEVWTGSAWNRIGEFQGALILDKGDKLLSAAIPFQFSSASTCGLNVSQNGSFLTKLNDAVNSYSLAVDPSNRPVVAYDISCALDADGSWRKPIEDNKRDLVVKRWSGTTWQTLGGVVDRLANKGAQSVALAVDSKNTVYTLFTQCVTTSGGSCTNQNLYLSQYIP